MEHFLHNKSVVLDCAELNEQFNAPLNNEFASWSLEAACNELHENGFTILEAKAFLSNAFMMLALSSII